MKEKLNPRTVRKNKVLEYMNKGLSAREAYTLVHPGDEPTTRRMQQLTKEHKALTLTSPPMVEAAHNVILETLEGKVIISGGEKIIPTASNRLQAAAMVLDRAEPIIRINQNLNINSELKVIDLEKYRNASGE
jgi:hypothetical protein